jgi:hypothetical protein
MTNPTKGLWRKADDGEFCFGCDEDMGGWKLVFAVWSDGGPGPWMCLRCTSRERGETERGCAPECPGRPSNRAPVTPRVKHIRVVSEAERQAAAVQRERIEAVRRDAMEAAQQRRVAYEAEMAARRCGRPTKSGRPCEIIVGAPGDACWTHRDREPEVVLDEPPEPVEPEPPDPLADEIEEAKTPAGGWTKAQLAKWGIPWPPPKGWRKRLLADDDTTG